MRADEALSLGRDLLQGKVEHPARDAALLLGHVLGKPSEYPYLHPEHVLTDDQLSRYLLLLRRRQSKEPIAYLRGYQEFMGFRFKVDKRVLIPRPETEILVETALRLLDGGTGTQIADVCSGSGAIGLSVLKLLPLSRAVLTDISEDALAVARENAADLGVSDRAVFRQGDALNPLFEVMPAGGFHAILSNPPYIPREDIPDLDAEVRCFEPRLALDGGPGGLEVIRRIIQGAPRLLRHAGYLILEIGHDQADSCRRLFQADPSSWDEFWTVKDYAGIDRVFVARKRALAD